MSAVTANFTVAPVDLNFTVNNNDITFTPNAIALSIFTGGISTLATALNANIANVHIFDGANGYVLSTDGVGNLSWVAQSPNANYASYAGNVTINAQPNITSTGTLTSLNVTGTTTGAAFTANTGLFTGNGYGVHSIQGVNITGTVANANYAVYSGTVITAAQPNITSHGSLTGLTVSNASGTVNFTTTANVTLGAVANLHISGGVNGYILQTDGSGTLSWSNGGGSGNGVVGGSNTQIQFNDAGSFAGNVGFTFDNVTSLVNMPANLTVANNITAANILSSVTLPYGIENISIIANQTGNYNFNFLSNAINFTNANSTSNLILEFRGNNTITLNSLLSNGQSVTGTYVIKNGTTPYGIYAVNIDTVVQTINWVGNSVPLVYSNSYTAYTFTLIKTSTTPTYTVFASGSRY